MSALTIEHLNKIYANGVQALQNVSFTVEDGDFFALLGPNGAGKSTCIGIVTSLVNKTNGSVKVFGHDLDKEQNKVKSLIGMVPQEFNFNSFEKVIDIVISQAGYYGIPRKLACERAEKYLRQLALWDRHDQQARYLSGGLKRRLMIARALVHEPRLLILDEPTAGVDIELRYSMWEFIKQINQEGTTVILTTHYLEEAENLCRNIAIINHGQLVKHTSMKQLLTQLDNEAFVLYLDKALDAIPKLDGLKANLVEPNVLEIEVPKAQALNDAFDQLSKQKIKILSMRNKTNRLERLFMDLTKRETTTHA